MNKGVEFLLQVLRRCGAQALLIEREQVKRVQLAELSEPTYARLPSLRMTLEELVGVPAPKTLYRVADAFGLRYAVASIGDGGDCLFAGPYLETAFDRERIMEAAEQAGLSRARTEEICACCAELPIIPRNSRLTVIVDCFCERLWNEQNFAVVDVESRGVLSAMNEQSGEDVRETRERLVKRRYEYENELIWAVSRGNIQKVEQIMAMFFSENMERRVPDPVQNVKYHCIITNTLMRKAAEKGGVHLGEIDRMSQAFTRRIDRSQSERVAMALLEEIVREYCKTVRKKALRQYSLTVQRAVVRIESDLSSNLTLSALAGELGVSGGYLSAAFHRETGERLTDYVRRRRMEYARHLLENTTLQVQTVAAHCGMEDVQYFGRLFRRDCGVAPGKYREIIQSRRDPRK